MITDRTEGRLGRMARFLKGIVAFVLAVFLLAGHAAWSTELRADIRELIKLELSLQEVWGNDFLIESINRSSTNDIVVVFQHSPASPHWTYGVFSSVAPHHACLLMKRFELRSIDEFSSTMNELHQLVGPVRLFAKEHNEYTMSAAERVNSPYANQAPRLGLDFFLFGFHQNETAESFIKTFIRNIPSFGSWEQEGGEMFNNLRGNIVSSDEQFDLQKIIISIENEDQTSQIAALISSVDPGCGAPIS